MANRFEISGQNCIVCGHNKLNKFKANAFDDITRSLSVDIVECESCFFAWQYPIKRTDEDSINFFDSAYEDCGNEQSNYFNSSHKEKISELTIEFIGKLSLKSPTLLDIGSESGFFAKIISEKGWDVVAVDPALQIAGLKNSSVVPIRGTVDQIPNEMHFNVITLWDVIEHVNRPDVLISKALEHLSPGGWLVIETGNYKSAARIMGGKNHWIYQLDHRWYFSPESIMDILSDFNLSEFIISDVVLRPQWKGKQNYTGPSKVDLMKSIVRKPTKVKHFLDRYSALSEASRWPMSGLDIFTLAARKKL